MKNEHIIGVLVVALLALGILYLGRGSQLEVLREELEAARHDVRIAQSDAGERDQRLHACSKVLARGRELIEAQARRIYRLYDDEMPALAREAFDEGTVGDEEEFFFGTIRRLDELSRLEGAVNQDLPDYGWAPSSSLADGDVNLAATCLGIDEESLHQ